MQNDYQELVDECKGLVVEGVHESNWKLIETYWTLGKNIRSYSTKYKKDSGELIARLANDIKLSKRTVYYAVKAFDKYPNIDTLPEGKAINWNKLVTKYLPEGPIKERRTTCPKCGYSW